MSTVADGEELLTQQQVADRLGVSLSTVRNWTRDGRIPVYRPTERTARYFLTEVLQAIRRGPCRKGQAKAG